MPRTYLTMQEKKMTLGNSLLYQTATFNLITFIALLESQERNGGVRGQLHPECSSHLIAIISLGPLNISTPSSHTNPSTGGNKGALSAIRLRGNNWERKWELFSWGCPNSYWGLMVTQQQISFKASLTLTPALIFSLSPWCTSLFLIPITSSPPSSPLPQRKNTVYSPMQQGSCVKSHPDRKRNCITHLHVQSSLPCS